MNIRGSHQQLSMTQRTVGVGFSLPLFPLRVGHMKLNSYIILSFSHHQKGPIITWKHGNNSNHNNNITVSDSLQYPFLQTLKRIKKIWTTFLFLFCLTKTTWYSLWFWCNTWICSGAKRPDNYWPCVTNNCKSFLWYNIEQKGWSIEWMKKTNQIQNRD